MFSLLFSKLLPLQRRRLAETALRAGTSVSATSGPLRTNTNHGNHNLTPTASGAKPFKVYTSKTGHSLVYAPCRPPPGFVFVPAGIRFITQSCRESAEKFYIVLRRPRETSLTKRTGLFVPTGVFTSVKADFDARRKKIANSLWKNIEGLVPRMPDADKRAFHSIVSSRNAKLVGKRASDVTDSMVLDYIRNRFIPLKSSSSVSCNEPPWLEESDHSGQKAEEILASWRGCDSSGKEKNRQKH